VLLNKSDKIRCALIDLLVAQARRSMYANLAMLTLVGMFIWTTFPGYQVGIWIFCGYLIPAFRRILYRLIKTLFPALDIHTRLERTVGLLLFFSGVHWGVGAWLFLELTDVNTFTFISAAILGVVSASLSGFSVRPIIWFIFSGTIFLFVIAKLLALGNWPMAIMSVIYLSALSVLCQELGKRVEHSITQDFRNAELLEEVREAKDTADKANLAKSQFMAAASHDLRQPLHAQGILLETLRSRLNNSDLGDITDKIVQSNASLNTLFNALLEISQLDAGTIKVHPSHQSLSMIIKIILDEFRQIAEKKNISLTYSGPDLTVYSDSVLLTRVLRNLVSNAIKFTEKGEVTIQVERNKNKVRIAVDDTGIGIPVENQSMIFNEYTQLGNKSRDRSKGIGLGLALVRRMCYLLDHELKVESVLGKGSSFSLIVPLGDTDKIFVDTDEQVANPVTGIDILLIDDEQPILDAMKTMLSDWSCQCRCFTTLKQAESSLEDNDSLPDIIISDYRLTDDVTGMDAIRRLRSCFGRDIPALLISGDTDPDLLKQAQREDFYLLHKPLKPTKLRAVIGMLLDD